MGKRRFTARLDTIQRDLKSVMVQMGATSLRLEQDFMTGMVKIIFDRAERRYIFSCDRFEHLIDNFRAAQLAIAWLWRALEAYGVQTESSEVDLFQQFFLGFEVTPDTALLGDGAAWWDVLGTVAPPNATQDDVRNAYRALARVTHPDAGGTGASFQRVSRAYSQAMNYFRERVEE